MKPKTNAPSEKYTGGSGVIKHSPIKDHSSGDTTTVRKK